MAKTPQVEMDFDKVIAALQAKSLKGRKRMTVKVQFTAPYAVYVHEDMGANHPNGGQAKYLSTPAASAAVRSSMAEAVKNSIQAKNGLEEGLQRAGNRLLQAAIPLVPVDTGFLRDSGTVTVEAVEGG